MLTIPTLKLVRESKICDLLPHDEQKKERWEASGVLVKGSDYFVVFDDRVQIARISNEAQKFERTVWNVRSVVIRLFRQRKSHAVSRILITCLVIPSW
jgi:hypothetical protein